MNRRRAWWVVVPALPVLLALNGSAEAVIADSTGSNCLPGLPLKEARADGADRSYVWEGVCPFELNSGPSLVSIKVTAKFDASKQEATETFVGGGPGISGKVLTSKQGCAADPFVTGAPACTGSGSASQQGLQAALPPVHPPLMAGRIPANQVYKQTLVAAPLLGAGQVRITKPVDNQSFMIFKDKLSVEVRFAPANFTRPPKGPVGLQWGRETSIGTCTFDLGYIGIGHYSMAQMLGKGSFPSPGRYCLRATSKAGTGSPSTWTEWSAPVRIEIGEVVAGKAPPMPPGSSGLSSRSSGESGQGGAGAATPRLRSPELDGALRELQGLERRLVGLGSNADAAKLLGDVRAYRARLAKDPDDVTAFQKRLRELTSQVADLEASVKTMQSTKPRIGVTTTPKAVGQ